MISQEILQLIKQGESDSLELKRSLGERREIVETAAAFANASGGIILVGVSPQQEIIGIQIGTDTLESLANSIKQNTDPAVLPSREYVELTGISPRTATRDLVDLVGKGILRQTGRGKGSHFELLG